MNLHAKAGVTLIELLTAIAISGLLGIGIATFITRQQQAINDLKFAMNMRAIANRVSDLTTNPQAIMASALYATAGEPGNQKLRNCITYPVRLPAENDEIPTGANALIDDSGKVIGYNFGSCESTDPEQQVPIALMLPPANGEAPQEGELTKNKLAGGQEPVWYNIRTRLPCVGVQGPTGECPVKVTAFFWATCPPSDEFRGEHSNLDTAGNRDVTPTFTPQECLTADAVHIRFQVVHEFKKSLSANSSKRIRLTKKLSSIPMDDMFWKDPQSKTQHSSFGALTTQVSTLQIEKYLRFQCDPNETMIRIENAKPVCECKYPFKQIQGAFGQACVPRETTCGVNERYLGMKANGDIICQRINCDHYVYVPRDGYGCRPGGFLRSIEYITPDPRPSEETKPDQNACFAFPRCNVGKNGGACDKTIQAQCYKKLRCCYEVS